MCANRLAARLVNPTSAVGVGGGVNVTGILGRHWATVRSQVDSVKLCAVNETASQGRARRQGYRSREASAGSCASTDDNRLERRHVRTLSK